MVTILLAGINMSFFTMAGVLNYELQWTQYELVWH